ncbi:MAG TPA: hypothetical protein VKR53_22175 [Puia sp.]|nr:hypothetical protein [Puia sp.]
MEVHHHPDLHHKKKNFKEYFLEFLMIFLAVTLGFIAENVRENISEHSQANELAKSLYKEIYSDSISIQQKLEGRLEKENYIKYFVQYVRDSNLVNLSPNFYPAFTSTFISTLTIVFQPKDGILNQLTNSGALRYFKSNKLQEEIGNISVAIANLREGNKEEETFRESKMRAFIITHYDYKWFEELAALAQQKLDNSFIEGWFKKLDLNMIKKPEIINSAQFNRQVAANIASEYLVIIRGFRLILYNQYAKSNHLLLETLRDDYNISE